MKANRNVIESPDDKHKSVDSLVWTDHELNAGKTVHLKKFSKGHQVKLFRMAASIHRTEYMVTQFIERSSG